MVEFKPMFPVVIICAIGIIAVTLLVLCLIRKKQRKIINFRRISILFLIVLILIRPVFPDGSDTTEENNINIFFAVDSSSSMSAKDVDGKRRFEQVKDDIVYISNELPGSQYSIITLDSVVHTTMPLSSNVDLLKTSTEMILPNESLYGGGTNLNDLLNTAEDHIKTYSKKNPDKINVLFVFSDGEDTTNSVVHLSAAFKNIISGGAVFGYGSEDGALIEDYAYDRKEWSNCVAYYGLESKVRTEKVDGKNCVISSINETFLKNISNSLNLDYYHRNSNDMSREIIDNVKANIVYRADSTIESHTDIYWLFAIVAICLLLWEFADSFYKILLERSRDGRA